MSKQPGHLNNVKPAIRFLNEMQPVLYDQRWFKKIKHPEKFEVYYVWRGVKTKNGLRYDLTVIPPKMLGKEFPKTKGHCHLGKTQELIQVLKGRAFYFAQKSNGSSVADCYVIEAKKGDVVFIPQGLQHLTINPSKKEELTMANWISEKAKSDYSFFERLGGACYYYTQNGWLKNKNYKKVPKLKIKKSLGSAPKDLSFLTKS